MKKFICFFAVFIISMGSYAKRVEMKDKNICNGYTEYTGRVVDVIATTNYDSYENVYANMYVTDGSQSGTYQGGVIYYRSPYHAGYIPMINMVTIANITGAKTTFCMKKDGAEIYAVLLNDGTPRT